MIKVIKICNNVKCCNCLSVSDIKQRIGKQKQPLGFRNLKNVLLSRKINLTTRHCYMTIVCMAGYVLSAM